MFEDVGATRHARSIAVTQEHRGHGVSTAAYYLGRVLVAQGLRVLLVDLTGRRSRLSALVSQHPVKNLVLWAPPLARPQDVRPALDQARIETAGRVDVLLLDADSALLERAGGLTLDLDYVLAVVELSDAGQRDAERIALRLRDEPPPQGRVGLVFSRVDRQAVSGLPERTAVRHLPVLGHYLADYLLAGGDAYSLKGGEPSFPHDAYLQTLAALAKKLTLLAALERVPSAAALASAATEVAHRPLQ
jgi:hypothetical protein